MNAACSGRAAARAAHPGWLARLARWCSGTDAAWLALGQRTHPHDWWAGA